MWQALAIDTDDVVRSSAGRRHIEAFLRDELFAPLPVDGIDHLLLLSPAVNFHSLIYQLRPDVNATVHLHSRHISVLSSTSTPSGCTTSLPCSRPLAMNLTPKCLLKFAVESAVQGSESLAKVSGGGPGSAAEIDIAFFPLDDHVAATSDVVEVRPPALHVRALNVELHGVRVGSGRRLPQQALDDLIAHDHRPSVVTVIHHRT